MGPCQAGGTRGRTASASRASASTALTSSRGAFGTCPHRTEDVPLVGLASDEGLEPVDDRLGRMLDVVRSLLRTLDENGRERDAAEGVVALAHDRGDDDRRARHARKVRGDRGEGRAHPEEEQIDMVELVRARAEIHHEPDHLVAAESLQYLAHRPFWREDGPVPGG